MSEEVKVEVKVEQAKVEEVKLEATKPETMDRVSKGCMTCSKTTASICKTCIGCWRCTLNCCEASHGYQHSMLHVCKRVFRENWLRRDTVDPARILRQVYFLPLGGKQISRVFCGRFRSKPHGRITNDFGRVRIKISAPPAKAAVCNNIVVANTH